MSNFFPAYFWLIVSEISTNIFCEIPENIFWINATYKAEDFNLNFSSICSDWQSFWKISESDSVDLTSNFTKPESIMLIGTLDDAKSIMSTDKAELIFNRMESIGIYLEEICQMFPRLLWINSTEESQKHGLNTSSVVCLQFNNEGWAQTFSIISIVTV